MDHLTERPTSDSRRISNAEVSRFYETAYSGAGGDLGRDAVAWQPGVGDDAVVERTRGISFGGRGRSGFGLNINTGRFHISLGNGGYPYYGGGYYPQRSYWRQDSHCYGGGGRSYDYRHPSIYQLRQDPYSYWRQQGRYGQRDCLDDDDYQYWREPGRFSDQERWEYGRQDPYSYWRQQGRYSDRYQQDYRDPYSYWRQQGRYSPQYQPDYRDPYSYWRQQGGYSDRYQQDYRDPYSYWRQQGRYSGSDDGRRYDYDCDDDYCWWRQQGRGSDRYQQDYRDPYSYWRQQGRYGQRGYYDGDYQYWRPGQHSRGNYPWGQRGGYQHYQRQPLWQGIVGSVLGNVVRRGGFRGCW